MSCSTCKNLDPIISVGRSGLDYVYKADVTHLATRTGQFISLEESVVKNPHGPSGGWSAVFFINSQRTTIPGRSPLEVFVNAAELFRLNNVPFTERDMWLNLNIQWLQKQVERYRIVQVEELFALSMPVTYEEPQGLHQVKRWETASWAPKAWGSLELYLVDDNYAYSRFIVLVEELQVLYNPSKSPSTGDSAKNIQLTFAVDKLKKNPLYLRDEARDWLWFAETQLGLIDITFETFSKNNHWL